jgi:hypothetical protein
LDNEGRIENMTKVQIFATSNPEDPTELDIQIVPDTVLFSLHQNENTVKWESVDGHPFSVTFTAGDPFTRATPGSDPHESKPHQQSVSQSLMITLMNEELLPKPKDAEVEFPFTLTVTAIDSGMVGTMMGYARGRRRRWGRD